MPTRPPVQNFIAIMNQMQVKHNETAKIDPNCEIRLGIASWDDGSNTAKSVKYTWFDKNGKAARPRRGIAG